MSFIWFAFVEFSGDVFKRFGAWVEERLVRAHVVVSNRVCMCVGRHWNKKIVPIRQAGKV